MLKRTSNQTKNGKKVERCTHQHWHWPRCWPMMQFVFVQPSYFVADCIPSLTDFRSDWSANPSWISTATAANCLNLVAQHRLWFGNQQRHRQTSPSANYQRSLMFGICRTLHRMFLRSRSLAHQIAHLSSQCCSMCQAFQRPTMEFSMVAELEHACYCD